MNNNNNNINNSDKIYVNEDVAKQAEQYQKQENQQTKAEYRKNIFKKYNKLWFEYQKTANFKEPILILMRRNNKAEFFEKATEGEFKYQHSDGTERSIILTTKNMQTFDYGQNLFKGYICHEDYPIPLPDEPILLTETFQIAIEKSLNDYKKWKAEQTKAYTDMIWKTGLAIGAIILAFTAYKMFAPQPTPTEIAQAIINITQNQTENITKIINSTTGILIK